MEIKNVTTEQINRFIEIRALLEKYNKDSLTKSLPFPNISIDERMQCEWYFSSMDAVPQPEMSSAG